MGLNSAIREIALSAAREVVREELKQRELAPTANASVANGPEPLLTVDDVAKLCSVTPQDGPALDREGAHPRHSEPGHARVPHPEARLRCVRRRDGSNARCGRKPRP
jgi:hypothetical protein